MAYQCKIEGEHKVKEVRIQVNNDTQNVQRHIDTKQKLQPSRVLSPDDECSLGTSQIDWRRSIKVLRSDQLMF